MTTEQMDWLDDHDPNWLAKLRKERNTPRRKRDTQSSGFRIRPNDPMQAREGALEEINNLVEGDRLDVAAIRAIARRALGEQEALA